MSTNRFKSTTIFGNFQNSNTPDNSILANGIFDGNLTIKNDLNIGLEVGTPVMDASGNVINTTYNSTGGNIKFDYNGISYTIGKAQLIKLLNNLATESFVNTAVQNAISSLINNSPVSLDTLFELSQSLGNDPNFATTVSTNLGLKANIASPTFTGTITTPNLITTTMTLNGNLTTNSTTLTPIEISRLTGITTNIQTQLNDKSSLTGNNTFSGTNTFTKPIIMNNNSNYLFTNSSNGYTSLTGANNIYCGVFAGRDTTSGASNIYMGNASGLLGTTATNNTFIGQNTGRNNTTGSNSVFIGTSAGYTNTSNSNSIIIGYECNSTATSGGGNIFIGFRTAQSQKGTNNTIIGISAFNGDTTDVSVNTGNLNSGFGRSVLTKNTIGEENCAFGRSSLNLNTTGDANTAYGSQSLVANVSGNFLSGFGFRCDVDGLADYNNSTAIGAFSRITASNQIVLGNTTTNYGTNNANVPAFTTTYISPTVFIPSGKLTLGGTYRTGSYNIDLIGNINTTTGYFDNGTNINTIYQPISSMNNYYLKSEIDTTFNNYYTKSTIDTTLLNYYLKSEIDTTLLNYYTKSTIDTTLLNYYTKSQNDTTFTNYYLKSQIDTTFTNYYLKSQIDTTLLNYYTKTQNDTTLLNYYTKTEVDNISFNNNAVLTNYLTISSASLTYAPLASPIFTGTVSGINKSMVGLGNVDNTTDLLKPISTATQTALNLKANLASPTFTGTVEGITKAMVGLTNVDNTTDLLKPVSTATQTALNLKANLASPSFTGTITAPIINASGLITANGSLTIPTTKTLNLIGDISANATTITPTELSYLDNVSSNIQTQLTALQNKTVNMTATATTTDFSQTTNMVILKASGLITANGGLDIPSTKTISLVGNIIANSITVTPVELSYLDTVNSNIQTQLNNRGLLDYPNSWTKWNNFLSGSFCDHTNTTLTRTADVPTQQGLHLQWNRDGTDGYSYIMNNKGGSSTNSGFRFQRYNGSGTYIDEPLTIADTINMTSPLNVSTSVTAYTGNFTNANIDNINGKFFVTKDINAGSSNQSVIYQAGPTVIYAGQTNNTQHMFACLDSSGIQTTPLTITSTASNFLGTVSIPTIDNDILNVRKLNVLTGNSYIEVNSRTRANINCAMANPNTYTPVYLMNATVTTGMVPTSMIPIFCSYKNAGKFDDLWCVAPGYLLELFYNANYTPLSTDPWPLTSSSTEYGNLTGVSGIDKSRRFIDNTNGTTWKVLTSQQIYGSINQVGSFRIQYQGNTIDLPIFS